jgi:dUTP pyrophosphatase
MKVKIKRLHENAVIPKYAIEGDAGMDLTATEVFYEEDTDTITYKTGIALEIPEGHVGLIFPRSSISKKDILLSNSVGVIDSLYRGEIMFKFKVLAEYWEIENEKSFKQDLELGQFNFYNSAENEEFNFCNSIKTYAVGDRIGQIIIIPYPKIEFEEVEDLSTTERGTGGYGSTGV